MARSSSVDRRREGRPKRRDGASGSQRSGSSRDRDHDHDRDRGAGPLGELRALYGEVDAALAGWGCEASTDCCRFGVTGREPYPTAVELAELERAVRARGGLPKRRTLPAYDERRCSLLGDDGRCLVYASRPFGCRTFFCDRGRGPVGERADSSLPRAAIADVAGRIAALSSRFAPQDPGPRPLSRSTAGWRPDAHGRARR